MRTIVLAHNIRSTHNVGAIFRTAEGLGIEKVILSGYTPYPRIANDDRLPHIAAKLTKQIEKTALGASALVSFEHTNDPRPLIAALKTSGWRIVALEQSSAAIPLDRYQRAEKVCLILGEEVHGVADDLLLLADDIIEIPMKGQKESFNVSVAAGIALYRLTLP